ncbi:uncharacterized protein HD556DRAFT_1000030 [Suillus plorans]|uniref:Uncharacterized protein n=1 Tax=Suillus plorans TaxID=116603 RepID=A0A9P7ADA0_9AGAM|nr:uncharacterized protein HD556DRAFT_1000030 [Suillus plorans]KAG1787006.1 hypothetical protein HD556DRAFT_1000030 [Suillus plorans]
MSSVSTHTPPEGTRYWHYPQPSASSSQNPIPCDALNQSSHVTSRPSNQSNGYAEGFDISVKVKRAFTFEELQSDSDQGGWSLQGQTHMQQCGDSSPCITTAQYTPHTNPSSFQISKSYTLVDSLGQLSTSTSARAPIGTRVSAMALAGHSGVNPIKRESSLIQQVNHFCGVTRALFLTASLSFIRPLGAFQIHRTSHHRFPPCVILDNQLVRTRRPSR